MREAIHFFVKKEGAICQEINYLTYGACYVKIFTTQRNQIAQEVMQMRKRNERGAGRKPSIQAADVAHIKKRHERGETIASLAKEYGVSRQTMSGYLNRQEASQADEIYRTFAQWKKLNQQFSAESIADYVMRMDYMCGEECCTVILIDFKERKLLVQNQTEDVLHRAFGIKAKPSWEDFEEFLESRCFPKAREHRRMILEELELDFYDPLSIVEKTKGRMAEDLQWIQISCYEPAARR